MDHQLTQQGKTLWNRRLQSQRKGSRNGRLKDLEPIVGRDKGGISKFENGDSNELRVWFRGERAERYARRSS